MDSLASQRRWQSRLFLTTSSGRAARHVLTASRSPDHACWCRGGSPPAGEVTSPFACAASPFSAMITNLSDCLPAVIILPDSIASLACLKYWRLLYMRPTHVSNLDAIHSGSACPVADPRRSSGLHLRCGIVSWLACVSERDCCSFSILHDRGAQPGQGSDLMNQRQASPPVANSPI